MKYSLCIEPVFENLPFYDRIQAAKDLGLDAVEFWDPSVYDTKKIGDIAARAGMPVAAICLNQAWTYRMNFAYDVVRKNVEKSIAFGKDIGCKTFIGLAGDVTCKADTQKTLLISKTMGIEGKQLLTPEDDYEALKEFNHNYEGTRTVIENLHLEYRDLIKADPALEAYLKALPGAMFSGRQRPTQGTRGVFFCYALPAFDKEASDFTEAAGTAGWYLYDLEQARIFEEPAGVYGAHEN